MLGKLWYHTFSLFGVTGGMRWLMAVLVLIVSSSTTIHLTPIATGHVVAGLSMFRTPAAIERVVPAGPMRENATLILG